LGHSSLLGGMKSVQVMRWVAIGLFVLSLVLTLFGRWKHEMPWPIHLGSSLSTGLIAILCIYRLVMVYGRVAAFDEDDPRARAFYQRACDVREMEGCVLLGTCYWTGTCGVSKDTERAVELFERACNGGAMNACGQLGSCFEFGECGLRKNGLRAVSFYEKACVGGEMDMCNNLGVCYHKGQCGLAKDARRATALYQKACDGGYSGACHNLDLLTN
jgi:TPR repeat protein